MSVIVQLLAVAPVSLRGRYAVVKKTYFTYQQICWSLLVLLQLQQQFLFLWVLEGYASSIKRRQFWCCFLRYLIELKPTCPRSPQYSQRLPFFFMKLFGLSVWLYLRFMWNFYHGSHFVAFHGLKLLNLNQDISQKACV